MLEGIEGATAITNDILIAGRDQDYHDHIIHKVIERTTGRSISTSAMHVNRHAVPYVNKLITAEGLKPDPGKVRAISEMLVPEKWKRLTVFLSLQCWLPSKVHHEREQHRRTSEGDVKIRHRVLLATGPSNIALKELCSHSSTLA